MRLSLSVPTLLAWLLVAETLLLAAIAVGVPTHTTLTAILSAAALPIPLVAVNLVRLARRERRQHAALDLSERQAELALTSAQLAYFDVDVSTGKGTVNARWHELLGTSPDEIGDDIHNAWVGSLHPEDAQRVLEVGRRYKNGELDEYEVEYRGITRTGETRWFASKGMLVRTGRRQQPRMVGVFQDITVRKTAEAALREARDAAETASRSKSDFLANISHEVRTPMNGIIGLAEMLLADSLSGSQRQRVRMIRDSATSLLAGINDILDYTRVEAGRLGLIARPVDIRALVRQSMRPLQANALVKGLTLDTAVATDVPAGVVCDPARLGQVLVNLVGNAIKFTDHGGVTLSVEKVGDGDGGRVRLGFAVLDTGIGIPADKQALIFEAFSQVDPSASGPHGGSGLGLAIAARLVDLMGSSIVVASVPGQGSRFSFEIEVAQVGTTSPAPEPVKVAAGVDPSPPRPSLHVLVAEDNPVNQWVIRRMLEDLGYRMTLAEDGEAVLSAWRAGGYDAILMDIQMPKMDGYQATRRIRDHERTRGGRVPIIALTAHGSPDDRAKCLAAGMDAYLVKPAEPGELRATLEKLACPTTEQSPARVESRPLPS